MAAKNKPNEIRISRIYEAPVKAVWEAWTDVKQVAQWWGPRGFTLTTHSKELKPGGTWRYTMHGPDGTDYPNVTVYHEVEKHSRLVYDHGATDNTPPLFRVTVTFKEVKGKTHMDMIMALATAEQAEQTKKFIKQAGGNSTWDRLAEYLEKGSSGKETFVINRSFNAPITTIYEMWANPKHFSKWFGPIGTTMDLIKADIRPGGKATYVMKSGGGMIMYGQLDYLEMHPYDFIQYTQHFTDEKWNISRHPGLPTWPEKMLTTIRLCEEGPSETRVTVTWEVHGSPSAEDMATFVKERGSITQGWTGSFDRLDECLEKSNA